MDEAIRKLRLLLAQTNPDAPAAKVLREVLAEIDPELRKPE